MVDKVKLKGFMEKMVGDFGAAISLPLAHTGIRLGLYKAMAGAGPMIDQTINVIAAMLITAGTK